MKIFLKKISYLILSLTLFLGSCEVEESLIITSPDKEFVLNTPGISNIFLNFALPNNPAFTITWKDEVNTGATYAVEMSLDPEFAAPVELGSTDKSIFSMTVQELNDALDIQDVKSFTPTAIYIRLNTGSSISNSILFLVSKFAVQVPEMQEPASGNSVVLSDVDPELVALTLDWEDPEITSTSTVEVSYELQMAEGGTNFASIATLGETSELTLSLKHGELNEAVLVANGTAGSAKDYEFRIRATAKTDAGDLYRTSEAITLSITPYSVELPTSLFVVGAGALDAGWSWDNPVELVLQGKTYSGNIRLTPNNGGNFRFFTVKDDWGSGQNYTYYADRGYTFDSNLTDAMDGDNNFLFTGTEGEYFIEIDTFAETITLGPPVAGPNCNFDQLWVVGAGAADTGWNWANPGKIVCTGNGVYEGNINLVNDAFRFFTVRDDWGSGRNYPFYANDGYTIDPLLEDAMDGDNNFRFNGTPGEYGITIDAVNKTITLGAPIQFCDYDQLWLVGAATPGGWDWTSPTALPCVGKGVYSGDVTFTNEAFRFFTVRDDWGSGLNYPYYENEGYTIDGNFENALDGDSNFRFIGTPGTYKLTVDTNTKTIYFGNGCEFDQLWVVGAGAADTGWDWTNPGKLECTGAGVYEGTINLVNDAFRFFTVKDDWGSGRNFPYYVNEGYTIDANFEDAQDGDNNFRFVGTPGSYTIVINTNNKTISLN